MAAGARARQPHGANCVDIETYRVSPKAPLKLLGSAPIHMCLEHTSDKCWAFRATPVCNSSFGLYVFKEYGLHCLQRRMVKMKQLRGVIWSEAPAIVRRAVWPAASQQKCQGVFELIQRLFASSRWRSPGPTKPAVGDHACYPFLLLTVAAAIPLCNDGLFQPLVESRAPIQRCLGLLDYSRL